MIQKWILTNPGRKLVNFKTVDQPQTVLQTIRFLVFTWQTIDNGFTFSMTPIDNQMSIGFWMSNSLSYYENKEDVVQVEFEVKLPWVIDKALEYETS